MPAPAPMPGPWDGVEAAAGHPGAPQTRSPRKAVAPRPRRLTACDPAPPRHWLAAVAKAVARFHWIASLSILLSSPPPE